MILTHSLSHQSLKSMASGRVEKVRKCQTITEFENKDTKLTIFLPECFVKASFFPFKDDCAEAGEDERVRSAVLPPIDF